MAYKWGLLTLLNGMILQVASNILTGSDPVMENLPDDKIMGSSKKEVLFDSIFWQLNLGDPGSEKKNTRFLTILLYTS